MRLIIVLAVARIALPFILGLVAGLALIVAVPLPPLIGLVVLVVTALWVAGGAERWLRGLGGSGSPRADRRSDHGAGSRP